MASDAVVNLVVNATQGEAQINAQLRTLVNDAERRAPTIDLRVDVDTSTLDRRLQREFGILGTRMDSAFGVVNDSIRDGFRDLGNDLTTELRVISRQLHGLNNNLVVVNSNINRIGDNDGFRRVADDVDDTDRSSNRLGTTIARLGRSAGSLARVASRMTAIGAAAGGAVPLIASVATAVESIVPAAAAGVTAFVGLKAASLTLKVGLSGVEDAISAVFDPKADPEKVAEAMKHLSTNAQGFVKELQKLKPAFDDLRLDIQDRLFKSLDKSLSATAKATLPALRHASLGFADSLNIMGSRTAATAQRLGSNGVLGKALEGGRSAFEKLERVPSQVLDAILKLSAAGGPLLNRLTQRIADLADSVSGRLDKAFATGGLQKAVDEAGKTLAQLGRIAGNLFEALGNVFSAADTSGAGLFTTLEKITQALADATATTGFKDALGALADLASTVASVALPLLGQAFAAIEPVVSQLAPVLGEIVTRLGDELMAIIPALSPVLEQLGVLFGQVLIAVLPLIEDGLEVLIEIMPSLTELFTALTELVVELAPLITLLADGLQAILVPAIQILIMAIIGWVEIIKLVVVGIRQWIEWIGQLIAVTIEDMQPAIEAISTLLRGDFRGALNIAGQAVIDMVMTTLSNFRAMGVGVINTLVDMARGMVREINSGLNGMLARVRGMLPGIVGAFVSMGNSIVNTVVGLAHSLYQSGANMIRSLADGMLSQLGPALSAAQSIVGAIRDFFPSSPAKRGPFSGHGYTLYSGQNLIEAFAQGITSRQGLLESALSSTLAAPLASSGLTADLSATGTLTAPGAAMTAAARTTAAAGAPNVTVYLGNQLVRDYVTTVVDHSNAQRDRLAAQGARG